MPSIFTPLRTGIDDIVNGFRRHELWTALASEDIQQRYTRTGLGVFWIGISYALFILIYIVIFGQLAADNVAETACYISVGFLAWNFISGAITESLNVFIGNAHWIKAIKIQYSVFAFQAIGRLLFQFLFSFIITIGVLIYFRSGLHASIDVFDVSFSLLGASLLVFTAFWVNILLGIIALRFRDFVHFCNATLRIGFFVTPVLWEKGRLGEIGEILAKYNPFTYYIEIVRGPLLTGEFPTIAWIVVATFTVALVVVSIASLGIFQRKMAFWL